MDKLKIEYNVETARINVEYDGTEVVRTHITPITSTRSIMALVEGHFSSRAIHRNDVMYIKNKVAEAVCNARNEAFNQLAGVVGDGS